MLGWLIALIRLLGVVTAARAIMEARTAQGATAWAIALISFPYLALPLFWIFGRSKLRGYVLARRADLLEASPIAREAHAKLVERGLLVRTEYTKELPFERLAKLPVTTGNDARLLIDGPATFASIFAGIEQARVYVLVQFYILRDDEAGCALKARLLERARAGVRIYVLHDEIGSYGLPRAYVNEMRASGIAVHPFHARLARCFSSPRSPRRSRACGSQVRILSPTSSSSLRCNWPPCAAWR